MRAISLLPNAGLSHIVTVDRFGGILRMSSMAYLLFPHLLIQVQ